MKSTMKQFAQGDVLFTTVAVIPQEAKQLDGEGAFIFAYGEVTGHKHQVALADREGCEIFEEPIRSADAVLLNVRFLRVMALSGIDVVHEEHDTIHLDPGTYRVSTQREYAPEEIRRVAD